ncbi:type I-E CRISPR-associated protein Cas5/CasD [Leptonema illini]|uniref:CRISPR-associated protein, Cas5e family n=1 Tax=Leptonema illini DSM 21528 TaxID=929563 RepID=H2CA11_9LEPT|nr:type I-E CRISPR-associated protein Cas5/CasD [Leptonema illini]EHQ05135.1 CRISPR-associated protein, Cas5e family [Leptonema illini DSM 21528]
MQSYLVFHMHGALFAAGDTAVGEYRPSHVHPTKSGVLGLVAGAMGIRREEQDRIAKLAEAVRFSVLVLAAGNLLRDYHTVQVPSARKGKRLFTRREELLQPDLNTILSTRDYRQDALFRVALNSDDEELLKQIGESLQRPVFAPYLGRKSCPPALPFHPELVHAGSVMEAMKKVELPMSDLLKPLIPEDTVYFQLFTEDRPASGTRAEFQRRDRLIHRGNWQFGERSEFLIEMEAADVFQ